MLLDMKFSKIVWEKRGAGGIMGETDMGTVYVDRC